jgi:hypothetical protein
VLRKGVDDKVVGAPKILTATATAIEVEERNEKLKRRVRRVLIYSRIIDSRGYSSKTNSRSARRVGNSRSSIPRHRFRERKRRRGIRGVL